MGRSAALWESLYIRGSFADALGYATVIWPQFDEVGGMIFLSEDVGGPRTADAIAQTMRELAGDRSEVERQYNLVEVSEFFARPTDPDDDERLFALLLADAWKVKLSVEFPTRSFAVETFVDDDGRWITFHEERKQVTTT